MGSIPTLNMCDIRYTGNSVYAEARILDSNADALLSLVYNTLLAAGWTQTARIPDRWYLQVYSVPTQNPSGTLLPWTVPGSPDVGSEADPAGHVSSLYWFDPSRYSPPGSLPAHAILVNIGTTTTATMNNLGNAIATGTAANYDGYVIDSSGNYILEFSDAVTGTLFNSNAHAGLISAGSAPGWGYRGVYSWPAPFGSGNVHFVNGGAELESQAANGKTQYKVQLLCGGPVDQHIVAAIPGAVDYSGGATSHWTTAVAPGDGKSRSGQWESNIVIVKIIDRFGGWVTYELNPGWSQGGVTAPPANKFKIIANPYQFFVWNEGFAQGYYNSSMAHLFVCAPYTDNPKIDYCVVTASGWEFDASQYPVPPNSPFVKFGGDGIRSSPSWVSTYAAAVNDGFKTNPPSVTTYGAPYRGVAPIGLALGTPYPVYSMNGALIASTPFLVAPPGDPATVTKDAVIVGSIWDGAYLSNKFGNLTGPNDHQLSDSSYEQDSTFMGHNWKMVETSLRGASYPCQSLWMTYDN